MKKLLIALLLASTVSSAQDIPTLLKQVGDGYSALQVTNFALSKKVDSLNAIINKPIAIPPAQIINNYTKTFRYSLATYAYKFGLSKPGVYTSIPASKGGIPMLYDGTPAPTMGMPYITKDGLLFLQNQANVKYTANIKGDGDHQDIKNATYPREVWMVMYKPDYFMWEKYADGDFYMGDLGGNVGVRFTNDATIPTFDKAITPVNQLSIWRVRLTATSSQQVNVELWVNGVKQSSTGQVQTWFRKWYCVSLGTDTNNEYVGFAEIFHTPVLTDDQAVKLTQELQVEYVPYNLPIATNITYTVKGGNVTAGYTYNGKLPEGKTAKIRWVDWKNNGPAGSVYRPELDGKFTVPTFEGRAEITVYDTAGNYFDIPSTKYFKP